MLRIGFTDDNNPATTIRLMGELGGCRRRPVRSFHGLRATWMTMALNGGISIEDVQKISGSVDTETILGHYFHGDNERIRAKLRATMPPALGGEGIRGGSLAAASDRMLKLLEQMSAGNWEFISRKLMEELYDLRRAS